MPTSIRIERPDGTTETPVHVASSWTQKFGEMDMATINIPRSEGVALDLREDDDEVILEENGTDVFGGVLRATDSKKSVMELTVEGWETLAADAGRTPPGQRRENVSDGSVVSEAVSATPRLTAGTVNDVETGLTLVFASASQARKARQAEEAGGGELRYNADLTVDFVSSLGSDKSGSVVVAPGNQNTDGGVAVKKNTRVRRGTHLRVLGAGEGSHQRFANVVPNDDPGSYENEVRYDAGVHWEPGDRKKWETISNKEATTQSAVDSVGRAAAAEIKERHVTVTATIVDEDVALGDTLRVEKPADNINRDLRVVRRRRLDDDDGLRYECDLSNRRKFDRSPSERDRADTERYNRAFEGTPVTMTTGGGRQPVSSSLNYEFSFYYPDEVAYEHRVKLFVKGLAYRAYSSGAATNGGFHTHDVTIDLPDHDHGIDVNLPDHDHGVSIDIPDHQHDVTIPLIPHKHTLTAEFLDTTTSAGHDHGYNAISPDNTIDVVAPIGDPQFAYITDNPFELDETVESTDDGGGEILTETTDDGVNEIISDTSEDGGGFFSSETTSDATPNHQHDPDPGVIESFPGGVYYPSGCDVLVNGQSVGVSLGDGSGLFGQEVDLAGELNPGQINTIEVTSSQLGHVQAHLDVDVYRQILGDG